MRNAEWKKQQRIPNFTFRIPNSVALDKPASKLRIVDCGMRIEKGKQKNPKSAIRNNWGDAFSARRPHFRATSLLFRRKEKIGRGQNNFPSCLGGEIRGKMQFKYSSEFGLKYLTSGFHSELKTPNSELKKEDGKWAGQS